MAKKFLNLTTDINLQSEEGKQTSNLINPNKPSPGHIIIKLLEKTGQRKIFEELRVEQHFTYREQQFERWQISR